MKKLILAMALIPVAGSVVAATDGALSAVGSQGTVDVTLTVGSVVKVSFPAGDIGITYVDDGAAETQTTEFCVYSNQASTDIDIIVDPLNTPTVAGSPVLESGAEEIPYTLALQLQGGASISAAADDIDETGITLASHTTADSTSDSCAGGNTHQFVVTVAELDVEAAAGGAYSDTIQVDVSPN